MIELLSGPSKDPIRLVLNHLDSASPILQKDAMGCAAERFTALRACGLVVPGETLRDIACDGCERGCWVAPRVARTPDGPVLVAPCVFGSGLVRFPLDRLSTWNVAPHAFAEALARRLGLVGTVEERLRGRVWWLGERRAERRRDVYFVIGLGRGPAVEPDEELLRALTGLLPLIVVPGHAPDGLGETVVTLSGMVSSSELGLEVDVERFEGRLKRQAARRDPTIPFPTPLGTRWEEVTIELLDNERAALRCRGREEVRTYIELGFLDGRSKPTAPRPSELWRYLRMFADEGGRITWQTASATMKLRDRMRELRTKLSAVFPIEEGKPIADYPERKAYETTFAIRRRAA